MTVEKPLAGHSMFKILDKTLFMPGILERIMRVYMYNSRTNSLFCCGKHLEMLGEFV